VRRLHDGARGRDRAQWPPRSIDEIRVDGEQHAFAARCGFDSLLRNAAAEFHAWHFETKIETRGACVPCKSSAANEPRTFRSRPADFLRTPISISRWISGLLATGAKVVRLLPFIPRDMAARPKRSTEGPTAKDVRIICDCQRHALRERTLWRRSIRAASQLKRGGVALLVGVPLAFGVVEIPTINSAASEPSTMVLQQPSNRSFHIFTSDRVRSQFLDPQPENPALTIEVTKEQFFRTRVPYGSIIYREAQRNQLPPELVAAVVEAESDFRPRLISDKNAQGLMQIVPSTGHLLGADDLFDPEQNIVAGTKYLKYLIGRFGNLHMALAAYNAGEGNIEKFGGIPPFPETLNYVQRVNSQTRWYRLRVRQTLLAAARMSTTYAR
jgi:Transglycosylase SLT domain